MSPWIWVPLVVASILVVPFVGMYFEHRAKWESGKPAFQPDRPHFHSIAPGVSFPCTDRRCPEWRADR